MSWKQVESLLEKKIGLSIKSVGHERIDRAVSQRMAFCGITDENTYLEYLSDVGQEWEELVEMVVIPETWFFRNRNSFLFLAHYAKKEWMNQHPEQSLRILSVPCATGEEAYSIAITLTDAGFPLEHLHLDGADISEKSLRKAAQGIYGKESFREKEEFRQLSDAIRQKIRWIKGNLLDPDFLINEMPYHIVFCRNLMIYLNASGRRQVMTVLNRLLSSDGLLFVGHAELPMFSFSNMTRISQPGVFALQKGEIVKKTGNKLLKHPETPKKPEKKPIRPTAVQPAPNIIHEEVIENKEENLLEQAKKLADKGYSDKAAELCRTYLSDHPADAEAHFMMGLLIKSLKDDAAAEIWFNKAVYLDPRHQDALHHLSLIREKRGDTAGAELMRQRARRSEK